MNNTLDRSAYKCTILDLFYFIFGWSAEWYSLMMNGLYYKLFYMLFEYWFYNIFHSLVR